MQGAASAAQAKIDNGNFFARARARLTLDAPVGLADPDNMPLRGDHDADPVLQAIAAVRPIKPAPGGKIDAGDATPLAAALREAQEEIGLAADRVDPIGYLDVYMTTLGFRIVPVLARVAPGFTLTLNPGEVDNAFEVPLAFLMEMTNHQTHSREWQGMMRTYYAIPFGERYIWGVTAGIFRNLYQRIYGE